MQLSSGGLPPDSRWVRLLGLAGAVVCALALPLAMASAGPVGDDGPFAVDSLISDDDVHGADPKAPAADGGHGKGPRAPSAVPSRSPRLLGMGLATAARCGPELGSPEGVEAQTCVLTQGDETWARTYYRNATGRALAAVLSLMGPGGRSVQMRCAVGAEDEPETCETPRERSREAPAAYTAVSEFAEAAGEGPLLLRSGSNSAAETGS
ncbi:hypothetical protein [Streptomyces sp. NPDC002588]|uniref:hypothetical protein n=1 Tax=Streptomyces sp. NPDC002588 TaxID=3154419 RepID=UPI003318468F